MARSKVKIVVDILESVKEQKNSSKTRIIQLANLDWDMASRYFNSLVNEGFLEAIEGESRGKEEYRITEKGRLLLKSLRTIRNVCSIF